jgi:hypothetical protein
MNPTVSSDLQDQFALAIVSGKGTFLDVGCGHGRHGSNSFVLEQLGWTGLLVDIDATLVKLNKSFRTQPCIAADVTKCNWSTMLDKNYYDYLSFDVDEATIPAVKNFPWDTVRFKVITIEHDAYRAGPEAREYIRKIMKKNNYYCVAADVLTSFGGGPFEDWYVDLSLCPQDVLRFSSQGKYARQVLYVAK